MKKQIGTLLMATIAVAIFSCSKSSDSASTFTPINTVSATNNVAQQKLAIVLRQATSASSDTQLNISVKYGAAGLKAGIYKLGTAANIFGNLNKMTVFGTTTDSLQFTQTINSVVYKSYIGDPNSTLTVDSIKNSGALLYAHYSATVYSYKDSSVLSNTISGKFSTTVQ